MINRRKRNEHAHKSDSVITPETAAKILEWQLSLPEEKTNAALIRDCMAVLSQANQHDAETSEKERVRKRIVASIATPDRKHLSARQGCEGSTHRPATALLVACCLLLVLGSVALATGILPWRIVIDKKNGLFDMQIIASATQSTAGAKSANKAMPKPFLDALAERDMEVALPQYLPEGFEFSDIESSNDSMFIVYASCNFMRGDETLRILVEALPMEIIRNGDYVRTHVMTEEPSIEYTDEGIAYCIYKNMNYINVEWQENEHLISITGQISKDEAKRMIESVNK